MFVVFIVGACLLSLLLSPIGWNYIYHKIVSKNAGGKPGSEVPVKIQNKGDAGQWWFVFVLFVGIVAGTVLHCAVAGFGMIPFVLTAVVVPNVWIFFFYPFLGLCKLFERFLALLAHLGELLATGKPKSGNSIS